MAESTKYYRFTISHGTTEYVEEVEASKLTMQQKHLLTVDMVNQIAKLPYDCRVGVQQLLSMTNVVDTGWPLG